jgi:hypothetical protein
MARPRNDLAATETHAGTEPGFRRAPKPLALSPCRQTAVRTAGQRSIRVTGLGVKSRTKVRARVPRLSPLHLYQHGLGLWQPARPRHGT